MVAMAPVAPVTAGRRVALVIAWAAAALMLLTPFIATLDDLLAALAQRLGLDAAVAAVAIPEARLVAVLLNLLGFPASSAGPTLTVVGDHPVSLVIGWNCVGWQGLVLLGLTLLVGLRPQDDWEARVHVVTIGVLGTIVINIARITVVSILAARVGYYPAIFVHDWAATIVTVAWLSGFWFFVQHWILDQGRQSGDGPMVQDVVPQPV
jgi:exosortase/archaeosortase family protein